MNAKNRTTRFLSIVVLFTFLLTACLPQAAPAPSVDDQVAVIQNAVNSTLAAIQPAAADPVLETDKGVLTSYSSSPAGTVYTKGLADSACKPQSAPKLEYGVKAEWDFQACDWKKVTLNITSSMTVTPISDVQLAAGNGAVGSAALTGFTPNWTGLDSACPSEDAFLQAHNLTADMVIFHPAPQVSWRDCQYVIELKPQYYGVTTIPQVNGYFYNEALASGNVTNMWGGDPNVTSVTLQWGFTATWGPANLNGQYKFVDPNNPCEILVEDFRFGLYWRLPNIGLPPVEDPYYTRNGPYETEAGNMSCPRWIPPAIDQVVAESYLQAAALYGGLANESEWTRINRTTWKWRYSQKVAGSADYCPSGMPCWQITYVPQNSKGYTEFWYEGDPKKFYASDLSFLMLGNVNPDEFTYHADPTK